MVKKIINVKDYIFRNPFFPTDTYFYVSLIKIQSEIFGRETPDKGKVKYTDTTRREEENNKADFLP